VNVELKKRWVESLRSGNYKQTPGRLKTDDGYCCLGVLCELSSHFHGWTSPLVESHNNKITRSYLPSFSNCSSYGRSFLPEEVERAAVLPNEVSHRLVRMNDTGSTFAEIADYIDANL
jgi:hypothetical protein